MHSPDGEPSGLVVCEHTSHAVGGAHAYTGKLLGFITGGIPFHHLCRHTVAVSDSGAVWAQKVALSIR